MKNIDYFDDKQFQAKMSNILFFKLLKYEDF